MLTFSVYFVIINKGARGNVGANVIQNKKRDAILLLHSMPRVCSSRVQGGVF